MTDEDDNNALAGVVSGGAIVFASKIVALGLGFLTQLIMARLLTDVHYGEVVLTLAIVNVAALIAKLGMDDGVMRQFPAFEDDSAKARGVIRASLVIAIIMGLIAALTVFGSASLVAREIFGNPSLIPLLRLGAVGIPFIVLGNIAVSLARGARDAKPHAYVDQLARPAMRFGFIAILIVAGYEAIGAITGQILAIVVSGILALYLASRSLPSFEASPKSMYRPVLWFSLPLVAFQGMGFLNSNLDIYMVGFFLDSPSVGVYNIALQLANLLTAVLLTVGFLLPPALTRLYEQGKNEEMKHLYQGLTKWTMILGIPIFTVLFFAPKLVIGVLFGSGYTSGASVLRVLLVGLLFSTVMGLNRRALIGLGHNRIVATITFVQVVLNGALNVLLIPVFGIVGAAVAMTSSIVLGNTIGVAFLNNQYGVHPFKRRLFFPLFALGITAIVGFGLLLALDLPTSFTILLVGVAYPFVVTKLARGPEDRHVVKLISSEAPINVDSVLRLLPGVR